MNCFYTHGNGIEYPKSERRFMLTPRTFKRRAYKMARKPKYIFVHYLDESKAKYEKYNHQRIPKGVMWKLNRVDVNKRYS
jgi:hypothetical protein